MRRQFWPRLQCWPSAAPRSAQNFPSRPITIIVPFSAGGPSDAMARILAERMKVTLGETVLVENVTGAGGSVGVGRAVRSPPDGYTVSFGHLGTHVANGAIYKLGYDLVTDLEPVALAAEQSDDHRQQERGPGKIAEGIFGVAEGAAVAADGRHRRRGLRKPHRRALFRERHRHQAAIRAVSRHRPCDERSRRRPDRPDRRPDFELDPAGARRQHPRLCHHRHQARRNRPPTFRPSTKRDCPDST